MKASERRNSRSNRKPRISANRSRDPPQVKAGLICELMSESRGDPDLYKANVIETNSQVEAGYEGNIVSQSETTECRAAASRGDSDYKLCV